MVSNSIRFIFEDKIKEIKKETVSLAVTSPPYNINKKYGKYNDNVSLNEWKELIKEVFF